VKHQFDLVLREEPVEQVAIENGSRVLARDQRREGGIERIDVDGDDGAGGTLGEPGNEAVADLAASACDEDGGSTHEL
jgi:hypothetical protein